MGNNIKKPLKKIGVGKFPPVRVRVGLRVASKENEYPVRWNW